MFCHTIRTFVISEGKLICDGTLDQMSRFVQDKMIQVVGKQERDGKNGGNTGAASADTVLGIFFRRDADRLGEGFKEIAVVGKTASFESLRHTASVA